MQLSNLTLKIIKQIIVPALYSKTQVEREFIKKETNIEEYLELCNTNTVLFQTPLVWRQSFQWL